MIWIRERLWVDDDDYIWLALVIGVALAIRVAWVVLLQMPPGSDAAAYDRLGWGLAQGSGYAAEDGTPTASLPVGYPAFLAVIYLVFGHSWLAAGLANALLGTASVVLTYILAREFLSSRLSLYAAIVVALLPSHIISFTSVLRNESLHTVLVLLALIATCHLVRLPSLKNAVLLGVIIGIGVYVRPILLLFPVSVAILLFIPGGLSLRRAVGLACVTVLASLIAISPWSVRNYIVMGEPVLTSTNGGRLFYMGNGPGATGEHRAIPPGTFSETSEITAYREGIKLAIEHMMEHPASWLRILPIKFFHLWASCRYNMGITYLT